MLENRKLLVPAAALIAVMLSASACQSRLVRAVAFWRHPDAPPVQSASTDPVRNALQNQAEGAFDPRTGGQVQTLESRLKLSPQDAALHVELGRAYENYAIDDLALEQFTRAMNLDPASLDALQGLTRLARKHPEQLVDLEPVARTFAQHHAASAAALSTVGLGSRRFRGSGGGRKTLSSGARSGAGSGLAAQ